MSETPDQAATRRRWVTLAEVVGVAGVLIAAMTLWLGWSDRRADRADKVVEEQQAAKAKDRFDVKAVATSGGDALTIQPDPDHALKDVTVRFPTALGVAAQDPADFAIAKGAFESALLKATDGGADAQTGRLPVLLTVGYWSGDVAHTTSGVYDVVWRTRGRPLLGRSLKLEGLRLRQPGGTQATIDAAWTRERH